MHKLYFKYGLNTCFKLITIYKSNNLKKFGEKNLISEIANGIDYQFQYY